MKTKSSGARAGAIFMKRRAPELELCHFYDSSATLQIIQCFSVFNGPSNFGAGAENFWMLEPELETKTLDSWSQSRSLKF